MTEGVVNSLLLRLAPITVALVMRLWFSTCRVRVYGGENFLDPRRTGKPVIVSVWHYALFYQLYVLRGHRATVMVSASRDGEYIARLVSYFGFSAARGSRNNKGVEGLKALFRAVGEGMSCALVADGSQGPPRVAQPGTVLLASRSGLPIIPALWSAARYFTVRSWDRTAIPLPFSRVDFYFGEPLRVPDQLSAEGIENYRLLLETRLNELYDRAWQGYGKNGH
jgi:lysophospholipid acyltransferase (LPLAT)-like uncharacterized protein